MARWHKIATQGVQVRMEVCGITEVFLNSAPISRVIGWMARAVVGATGRAGMCISST